MGKILTEQGKATLVGKGERLNFVSAVKMASSFSSPYEPATLVSRALAKQPQANAKIDEADKQKREMIPGV